MKAAGIRTDSLPRSATRVGVKQAKPERGARQDRYGQAHSHLLFSKLDLSTSSEDHRRVLAVLRFLDQPA